PRRLRGSGTASSTSASVGRSAAGSVRVRCSRWRESTLIGDDGTRTRPLFLIDWLRQPTIIRGRVCHLSSGVPSSACPGQGWGRLTSRERIGLAATGFTRKYGDFLGLVMVWRRDKNSVQPSTTCWRVPHG